MIFKIKRKTTTLLCLGLVVTAVGCTNQSTKKTEASSVSSTSSSSVSSSSVASSKPLAVGEVYSRTKMDPDIAYKVANKKTTFYWTLKNFGQAKDMSSDNETARDEIFGATQKVETSTGTYYRVFSYAPNGFENGKSPEGSVDYNDISDYGYVKADGLKRFNTIQSEWTYSQKQPYYLGNPYDHRIWNAPKRTIHYTYVTHVFDKLATTQFYATKEMVTYAGKHYVYLETATKQLGWVYKSPKTLISGWYRDPGKQFLKPTSSEHMKLIRQSNKSTGTRVDAHDSTTMPQKVYMIRHKQKHTMRILAMGMDNRPIVIHFKNNKATKVKAYEYWLKPWKTITSKKKLTTHFILSHDFVEGTYSSVHFYGRKNKKLVRVRTLGNDSYATTWVYKNGSVKFSTRFDKNIANYPLSDFQ